MGNHCMVEEPLYHQLFDLTSLHNRGTQDYQYTVTAGEATGSLQAGDQFRINVCGQIQAQQGECKDGVASCLLRGDTTVPLGRCIVG